MKPAFLFPTWFRYVGWGLVFLHVPIAVMNHHHGWGYPMDSLNVNGGLLSGEHLFFVCTTLLMSLGLFFVAFAREKIEDEQIWQLRLNSLRWAIYLNYLILILSLLFFDDTEHLLQLNLWVPLVFFILRFRWAIFLLNRSLNRAA